MIRKILKNKFIRSEWRFVGRLPKQYERNLFFITPFSSPVDYFRFYLALSSILKLDHQLFIKKTWYRTLLVSFFKNNSTYFKPPPKDIETVFTKKLSNQRQINVLVCLSQKERKLAIPDIEFYQYAKKNKIPITLIAIDHVEKMIKFHTLFYPSKDIDRDMTFVYRYFKSHDRKNKSMNPKSK